MTTTTAIATRAAAILGRPYVGSRTLVRDWDAVSAVRAAAAEAGYGESLLRWVVPARTLTGLARAYLGRYGQAYGLQASPVDSLARAAYDGTGPDAQGRRQALGMAEVRGSALTALERLGSPR